MFSRLFHSQKKTFHSSINGEIILSKRYGKDALVVDGATQSGGEIAPMWQEVVKKIYKVNKKIDKVLVLGVGGGSVISSIKHYYPHSSIVGVERDPTMITVAKEYFDLTQNKSITIIIANALEWVKKKQPKKFDLTVVDLYIGLNNPPESRTEVFLKRIKQFSKANGVILYNAHYKQREEKDYQELLQRCHLPFDKVEEVFSYPKNRVLLLKS